MAGAPADASRFSERSDGVNIWDSWAIKNTRLPENVTLRRAALQTEYDSAQHGVRHGDQPSGLFEVFSLE